MSSCSWCKLHSLQDKLQFFRWFSSLQIWPRHGHASIAMLLYVQILVSVFMCDPREPGTWLSLWDLQWPSRGSRRHGWSQRRRLCGLRRPASAPARRWCRRIAAVCHGGPAWPREPRSPPLPAAEGVSWLPWQKDQKILTWRLTRLTNQTKECVQAAEPRNGSRFIRGFAVGGYL